MFDKLKEIISSQLGISEDNISLNTSLREDLDADSLDLFELIMSIEERFNLSIPADDVVELSTVEDVIAYLKEQGVE